MKLLKTIEMKEKSRVQAGIKSYTICIFKISLNIEICLIVYIPHLNE
jgi:hypothetical protein